MISHIDRPHRAKEMRRTRSVALAAVALLVWMLPASATAGSSTSVRSACTAAAPAASSLRASPAPRHVLSTPSGTSSFQTYDDKIEDVKTAPDICASDVVTNDSLTLTAAMHIHDRDDYRAGDGYRMLFDTDGNPATGGAAQGVAIGAEYVIDISATGAFLSSWTGSSFAPVTPQPRIESTWVPGFGPAINIGLAELGNPHALNFVFATSNADDRDLAPDAGTWSYQVTPFTLAAGPVAHGPARAGKLFVARMTVVRSDFDIELDEGTIDCAAKAGGRTLVGRGKFADGDVVCAWRLPTSTRRKQLSGEIAATFQGVTASRAFHVRVK